MDIGVNIDDTMEMQVAPGGLIRIIYGTHTGNTMMLAEEVAEKVEELGYEAKVEDMEDFEATEFSDTGILLILVSTDGEGDPPLMSEDLLEYLQSKKAPDLSRLFFSVLALGDTTYTFFCKAGKDFDAVLEKLGGKRIAKRVDCDVDYEEGYEEWLNNVLTALKPA